MKQFRSLFVSCVLLTVLAACAGQDLYKPRHPLMGKPAENAAPEYLSGWNDGCDTGLSTMNPSFYKAFYKFKQDPDMFANPVYYKAWKDAYTYCRHYSFRYVWDALDRNYNKPLNNRLCVLCGTPNF